MLYLDLTNSSTSRHHSGLIRFSGRLWMELARWLSPPSDAGADAERCQAVVWSSGERGFVERSSKVRIKPAERDWLISAEIFAEEDRPGFRFWKERVDCRFAAIFHDAIPLRFPADTWPRSVARHPSYMKDLSGWDRVFGVSESSVTDLRNYWRWLECVSLPPVSLLSAGADFGASPRRLPGAAGLKSTDLLSVGILEPRKNQENLLAACLLLWDRGLDFRLHLVGRVNPYFGKPVLKMVRRLIRKGYPLVYHGKANDQTLTELYQQSRFSVFPSRAEGLGLPVLESLWMGVPCLASDIPAVREAGGGGGCVFTDCQAVEVLAAAMEELLLSDDILAKEHEALRCRDLPLWRATAEELVDVLSSHPAARSHSADR